MSSLKPRAGTRRIPAYLTGLIVATLLHHALARTPLAGALGPLFDPPTFAWPRVDTLLPLTDLVAFASHDKPDQAVIVAWADAVRIAGHYMQPVDGLHPPRMRVNVFPNGDEQAQLRAVKAV